MLSEQGYLNQLQQIASMSGWLSVKAPTKGPDPDLVLKSPAGRVFVFEWRSGKQELHFSAVPRVAGIVESVAKYAGSDRAPIGVIATSQSVSGRFLAAVAATSEVLIFEYSQKRNVDAVCRDLITFCDGVEEGHFPETAMPAGSDSDVSLDSINAVNIATATGKLEEAAAGLIKVISSQTTSLGVDHPSTLSTRVRLAEILRDQGNVSGARDILQDVFDTQTRQLGPGHPDTLMTRFKLVCAELELGYLADAETELREVLASQLRVLSP